MIHDGKRYSLNLGVISSPRLSLDASFSPDLNRSTTFNSTTNNNDDHSYNSFYKIPTLSTSSDFMSSKESLQERSYDCTNCKILLLGDTNVGKTAIILRYCNELPSKRQYRLQQRLASRSNSLKRGRRRYSSFFITDTERKRNSLVELNDKRNSLTLYNLKTVNSFLLENDDEDDDGGSSKNDEDEEEIIVDTKPTVGIDIKNRLVNIDNRRFNCLFWDTAGQRKYQNAMMTSLYDDFNGIILTYDITNKETFLNCINIWLPESLRNFTSMEISNKRFYLIGNKLDQDSKRQVHSDDVLQMIDHVQKQFNIRICGRYEVSCKMINNSLDNIFQSIILDLVQNGCYEQTKNRESLPPLKLNHTSDNDDDYSDNASIYYTADELLNE